jgi:hypothetical protein
MMLQLEPPIPMQTPHGEGMAILVIDPGIHWNTVWCVALKDTLEIKHYESKDLKIGKNFTFGFVPKEKLEVDANDG